MELRVEPIFCSMSNAYLVSGYGKTMLIDAGMPWDLARISKAIRKHGKVLDLIFLTHAHPDHYGSSKKIQEMTDAPIAIHQADVNLLKSGQLLIGNSRHLGAAIKILAKALISTNRISPPEPNLIIQGEDDIFSLGIPSKIIHLPGHTPGSACLLFNDGSAFIGDLASSTVYPHTQRFFAWDWSQLRSSIHKLKVESPLLLFPGHGRDPIQGKFLNNPP